jgi:hypothetical protein
MMTLLHLHVRIGAARLVGRTIEVSSVSLDTCVLFDRKAHWGRKSATALESGVSTSALTAATTIAIAAVATRTTADARWRGWWGTALGGFALGAIVGSAFARPYYAYPHYGYGYGYPAYGYSYPAYSYGYPAYSYGYPATATHGRLIMATQVIGRGVHSGECVMSRPGPPTSPGGVGTLTRSAPCLIGALR